MKKNKKKTVWSNISFECLRFYNLRVIEEEFLINLQVRKNGEYVLLRAKFS